MFCVFTYHICTECRICNATGKEGHRLICRCGSELAREKMWSRIHLIPLLTAEEDRDLVRRHWADQAREKELLGKTTSPYNSDRYVDSFWVGLG